ncbi:hypothetical protein ACTXT7_008611 [Hymenolepis weldensis]
MCPLALLLCVPTLFEGSRTTKKPFLRLRPTPFYAFMYASGPLPFDYTGLKPFKDKIRTAAYEFFFSRANQINLA